MVSPHLLDLIVCCGGPHVEEGLVELKVVFGAWGHTHDLRHLCNGEPRALKDVSLIHDLVDPHLGLTLATGLVVRTRGGACKTRLRSALP